MPNVKQPQARTEVPDAQSTSSNPSAAEDGRGGVFSLGFLALVATQFFVSLNDKCFAGWWCRSARSCSGRTGTTCRR